jgi:hypothetical protein
MEKHIDQIRKFLSNTDSIEDLDKLSNALYSLNKELGLKRVLAHLKRLETEYDEVERASYEHIDMSYGYSHIFIVVWKGIGTSTFECTYDYDGQIDNRVTHTFDLDKQRDEFRNIYHIVVWEKLSEISGYFANDPTSFIPFTNFQETVVE